MCCLPTNDVSFMKELRVVSLYQDQVQRNSVTVAAIPFSLFNITPATEVPTKKPTPHSPVRILRLVLIVTSQEDRVQIEADSSIPYLATRANRIASSLRHTASTVV